MNKAMKCPLCNQAIDYFDLEHLFVSKALCNNCNKLFIYNQKNVKIKSVFIRILTLKYYQYLYRYYLDKNYFYDYEKHQKKTYLIDELSLHKIKAKRITILFRRQDIPMLKKVIKQVLDNRVLCSKIIFKEVLNFTKRTQNDC